MGEGADSVCPWTARSHPFALKNCFFMTAFMYAWESPFKLIFLGIKIWALENIMTDIM